MKPLQNIVPYIAAFAIGCGDTKPEIPTPPIKSNTEYCDEARQIFQQPDLGVNLANASCLGMADAIQRARYAFSTIQELCPSPPSEKDRERLLQQKTSAARICPREQSFETPHVRNLRMNTSQASTWVKSCEELAAKVHRAADELVTLNVEDATPGACARFREVYEDASLLMANRYEVCKNTHSRRTIDDMANGPAARALSEASQKLDEICPTNN